MICLKQALIVVESSAGWEERKRGGVRKKASD